MPPARYTGCMTRLDRQRQRVAIGLSALAGYVDAIAFIASGGYFVSFMSGNSTRLGVAIAGGEIIGIVSLLILAFAAWVLRSLIVAPFSIPSGSMLPTMMIGDYLFVSKWPCGYSSASLPFEFPPFKGRILGSLPNRGDVVVFEGPLGQDVVKRVIGLPGDTIGVTVAVRNTGDVAGDEVLQLYTRDPVASVTRPVLELQAFTRVTLDAGQQATAEFENGVLEIRLPKSAEAKGRRIEIGKGGMRQRVSAKKEAAEEEQSSSRERETSRSRR